jgi:hypothetical protein
LDPQQPLVAVVAVLTPIIQLQVQMVLVAVVDIRMMVEQQQVQLELPKAEEMEARVVVALPQVVAVAAQV